MTKYISYLDDITHTWKETKMVCEICDYFEVSKVGGFCKRFPQEIKKGTFDWCGEFRRK